MRIINVFITFSHLTTIVILYIFSLLFQHPLDQIWFWQWPIKFRCKPLCSLNKYHVQITIWWKQAQSRARHHHPLTWQLFFERERKKILETLNFCASDKAKSKTNMTNYTHISWNLMKLYWYSFYFYEKKYLISFSF